MKTVVPPIAFAGSQLNENRHVFAYFNSDDEAYRAFGGILQHNPFYVSPEQFLHEFRERRAGRAASL